jgi:methyl-accepting chemotaxis protein
MKKIIVKSRLSIFEKVFTIKMKLIISFMIAIALIIILGFASYQKAATALRKNYMESTGQTLYMSGEYLAFGLNSIQDTATQLINDDSVVNYFSNMYGSDSIKIHSGKQSITKLLAAKNVTDNFIENIYLLSDDVESITTKKLTDNTLSGFSDTAIGTRVQQYKMDVVWSGADQYLDEKLNTGETDYSLRFIRNMALANGIVIIDVSAEAVVATLENIKFDRSGILGIVTQDGKEITVTDKKESVFSDQGFYQEARNGKATNGSKYVDYQGGKYLFMYAKVGDTGAMICALVSNGTILKQADGIRLFTVFIVIIACIIATFNAFMITNGIDKVIKSMIIGLKKAAHGDLTVVFPSNRKDEFKTLIDEIQNTFTNMKSLIFGVKNLSSEVMDSSAKIGETTSSFQRSTENISFATGEVEQGIVQQAKDAEDCLSEMDNLSQKIISISENTREISRITEQTKISIQEGTQCTQRLNDQTKSTIQITTDIIKKVEQQAQKSLSISQISNVISDIASQINLLSLNASIESARAGEFGRGFAVIANEIRSLADQSKKSVDDIKDIISNIQEETNDTMQIAQSAEAVLLLQENAVSDTTGSYHNINNNVEQLVIYLKYITDTIDNMEESRVSTLGAIESISAVLEEIAASSNTVNQASKEQLISVESMSTSSEALNENANNLLHAVQKFTI